MASICNDERASSGVMSGHDRKTLSLSGRIGHAELPLGPIVLMLSEAFPEYGLHAPDGQHTPGASIHLHVDDCDAWVARLVAAGGALEMPATDQFYGERSARVRDPFGHAWLIGQSIEQLSPGEMQRRYTALMSGDAATPA